MEAFLHGLALALGLILPLGVQNLFVFNQGALQPNLGKALPVIITASVCDTLLILLAVLGVSLIILTFQWLRIILMIMGIIFLAYMGWITWQSKTDINSREENLLPPKAQILFALSVSLLNPHAIMDTVGVIGASSLGYHGTEKLFFTAACILVSWCWFLGLATAGHFLGKIQQGDKLINYLNKFSALIIWTSALYLASRL